MAILWGMDELVIGDKKYISSKRAAKETGYAKDYIGQLCREGRVPARLVGRSWYVLESAIHDHRFGEQKQEEKPEIAISTTWESPRYEAAVPEHLPLQAEEQEVPSNTEGALSFTNVSEHLEEAWKAWFERVNTEKGKSESIEMQIEQGTHSQEEVGDAEVVPIRAVYTAPPRELLPRTVKEEVILDSLPPKHWGAGMLWVRVIGGLTAIAMLMLAALGTGYFDSYLVSNKQVGAAAGILLYKK
jgi:hypothetical protein